MRCLAAFIQSPAGFERCARRAERVAATRGPNGNLFGVLLCREGMLDEEEHLLGSPPSPASSPVVDDHEPHARVESDDAPVERGPAPHVCTDCWRTFGSEAELADHHVDSHLREEGAA